MLWIAHKEPIVVFRELLHFGWQLPEQIPEVWTRVVIQNFVLFPCRWASRASANSRSSLPDAASCSICLSHSSQSRSASQVRNSANSAGESCWICSSSCSTLVIARSSIDCTRRPSGNGSNAPMGEQLPDDLPACRACKRRVAALLRGPTTSFRRRPAPGIEVRRRVGSTAYAAITTRGEQRPHDADVERRPNVTSGKCHSRYLRITTRRSAWGPFLGMRSGGRRKRTAVNTLAGLTDQTLSCTARAHVPKPTRRDTRLHVRRAMRVACRREGFDFTRRLGRRAEAGPCQLLRRVRRRGVTTACAM